MNGIYSKADTVITPDKAATVLRLQEMSANDWHDLVTMTDDELTDLKGEIDAANVVLEWHHPHNAVRFAAYEAIKKERQRRQVDKLEYQRKQTERRWKVAEAARAARNIKQYLAEAAEIPPAPAGDKALPVIDVKTASESDLKLSRRTVSVIVSSAPCTAAKDADALDSLKDPVAHAFAKELRDEQKREDNHRKQAADMLQAIDAELAWREEARAAREQARTPEALESRIRELEERITALAVDDD